MDIWIKQLILKVIHSIVPSSGLGEKLFVPILKLGREYFSNFSFEKSEDFHAWAFLDLIRHLFTFFTFSILDRNKYCIAIRGSKIFSSSFI